MSKHATHYIIPMACLCLSPAVCASVCFGYGVCVLFLLFPRFAALFLTPQYAEARTLRGIIHLASFLPLSLLLQGHLLRKVELAKISDNRGGKAHE